jgi:hypothetical protein
MISFEESSNSCRHPVGLASWLNILECGALPKGKGGMLKSNAGLNARFGPKAGHGDQKRSILCLFSKSANLNSNWII